MVLTERENEILALLKKEPLLSQVELSERLGISRSSLAVHISNLMKKGVVLGKGYVINQEASIVIFGESCMRININEYPQNKIDMHLGGFAVETARALTELGAAGKIVTVIGKDVLGDHIIDELQGSQIDVSGISRYYGSRSSRVVYINGALSFQEGIARTEYEKAADAWEWVIMNSDWLLIDSRLPEDIYTRMVSKNEERMQLTGTCIYIAQGMDIPRHCTRASLLVIGREFSENIDYLSLKMLDLVKNGQKRCIITDGQTGLIYMDPENFVEYPLMPNQGFAINERLPFLLAGMVYGLTRQYPVRQAVRIAVGTASTTEES